MKTIGLIGGMSWESTVTYYQVINRCVAASLGGLHSAKVILHSVDFAEVEPLQHEGRWEESARLLGREAKDIERAGADLLVICTNTMHVVAPQIEAGIGIPLLHITDPTGVAITSQGISTVGLIGTRFTMEQDFYRGRLRERYGLEVVVPGEPSRALVHEVIYSELCRGIVSDSSRSRFVDVVSELVASGAEAVVLGCTEVGLLLSSADVTVPLFDTTLLHAEAAARFALGEGNPL